MPTGTVVVTRARLQQHLERITVVWTSDGSGNVSGNSFSVGGGPLWQVEFVPGKYNVIPTNSYDIVINDSHGADVVIGKGANLSNVAASLGVSTGPLSWLGGGTLDVVVSNAGDSKQGTVILIIERV